MLDVVPDASRLVILECGHIYRRNIFRLRRGKHANTFCWPRGNSRQQRPGCARNIGTAELVFTHRVQMQD